MVPVPRLRMNRTDKCLNTFIISFVLRQTHNLTCLAIFGMFLIGTIKLYSICFAMSGNSFTILAQRDLKIKKYRNMVIDLGDGVKTDARLNLPAVGDGQFPGVLLIHGSGTTDMNKTGGYVGMLMKQVQRYIPL